VRTVGDTPVGRVSGWRPALEATPGMGALFAAGEAELQALLGACPELRHVLHLDLFHHNVLVAPAGSRLEAVFDWGCSAYGDFLYEVAWFVFWEPWYPVLARIDFASAAQAHYRAIGLELDSFDDRLRCYQLHVGLRHLAYATFTGRDKARETIATRIQTILRPGK